MHSFTLPYLPSPSHPLPYPTLPYSTLTPPCLLLTPSLPLLNPSLPLPTPLLPSLPSPYTPLPLLTPPYALSQIAPAFDSVVPSLLARADAIINRQCPSDSEYLYAVLKLLHRIGTRSSEGHRCVLCAMWCMACGVCCVVCGLLRCWCVS